MAEVVVVHHAQELPRGSAFASERRCAGHATHMRDLFAGRAFDTMKAEVGHAEEAGVSEGFLA